MTPNTNTSRKFLSVFILALMNSQGACQAGDYQYRNRVRFSRKFSNYLFGGYSAVRRECSDEIFVAYQGFIFELAKDSYLHPTSSALLLHLHLVWVNRSSIGLSNLLFWRLISLVTRCQNPQNQKHKGPIDLWQLGHHCLNLNLLDLAIHNLITCGKPMQANVASDGAGSRKETQMVNFCTLHNVPA